MYMCMYMYRKGDKNGGLKEAHFPIETTPGGCFRPKMSENREQETEKKKRKKKKSVNESTTNTWLRPRSWSRYKTLPRHLGGVQCPRLHPKIKSRPSPLNKVYANTWPESQTNKYIYKLHPRSKMPGVKVGLLRSRVPTPDSRAPRAVQGARISGFGRPRSQSPSPRPPSAQCPVPSLPAD